MKKYFLFVGIGKEDLLLNSKTMKDAVREARDIHKELGKPYDFRTCRALIKVTNKS